MKTYTLTDQQVEDLANLVRDKLDSKARQVGGYSIMNVAGEAARQMIIHHIKKIGDN